MITQTLQVGTHTVTVEVVRTPEAMAKGLGDYETLNVGQGMLFLYDEPTTPSFWMQGVEFPIDIVWLRDGEVVGIESRIPPDGGQRHYAPSEEVTAVLELASGAALDAGLSVGDNLAYESWKP